MNYLKLKQKIYEAIERNPLDRSAYEEMFAVCREYEKIDFQTAHAWNHELRNHISWGLRMTVSCQKFDEAREFDDLMFRSLLFGAQHFFDDYLQAVEYGKPLDKKFYQPRRHYLRRYVDAYKKWLKEKTQEFVKALADEGMQISRAKFQSATYDGTNDVSVSVESRGENKAAVVAIGSSVLFIEFGTGVKYPDSHPEAGKFGFEHGGYGHHLGRLEKGWRWQNVSIEDAAAIIQAFNPEYVKICYLDARLGKYRTSEFYTGDKPAQLYNSRKGIWSSVSFNAIERSGKH